MPVVKSLVLGFALSVAACVVCAAELSQPAGPVILTLEGAISRTNGDGVARFDRDMLEALSQQTIHTETPWSDGINRFEGPLGRALLDAVGAGGETLVVTALNDYSAEVPLADFYQYDVILALKINGEYMRIRDKGPLFIIYPFTDNPSLNTETMHNRSVWQVSHIRVK